MRLRNILFVVSNLEKSEAFYRDIFHMVPFSHFEGKVIMSEGLVLQEGALKEAGEKEDVLLYFEENDMKEFYEELQKKEVRFKDPLYESEDGRMVVRIYDPDFYLIEIGETMDAMRRRKEENES